MPPLFLLLALACDHGTREFAEPVPADALDHRVTIHQPAGLGLADVTLKDTHGHGPTPDLSWVSRADAPDGFHDNVGVQVRDDVLKGGPERHTDRMRMDF